MARFSPDELNYLQNKQLLKDTSMKKKFRLTEAEFRHWQKDLGLAKDKDKKAALLKDINKYQKMFGLKVSEDMGTVTGPHIAGTGDDSSTVVVKKKKKKKVYRRESLKKRVIDHVLAIQQKV